MFVKILKWMWTRIMEQINTQKLKWILVGVKKGVPQENEEEAGAEGNVLHAVVEDDQGDLEERYIANVERNAPMEDCQGDTTLQFQIGLRGNCQL